MESMEDQLPDDELIRVALFDPEKGLLSQDIRRKQDIYPDS